MRTPEDSETDPDNLIRLGTIASVDLAAARCVVELADGVESGPVRWIESRMGGTRIWSPPSVGEQVVLLCAGGEIGAGIVLRGLVSEAFAAPDSRAIDLIEFSDGAIFSYDPEAHALSISLPASGTASIAGDVNVTGTLTATVDVIGGGKSLKGHKHGGVQAGGAQTGTPV